MEAIQEKHQGLISGLTKLYNLLISMHYIYPGDVIYLPQTESMIDVQRLHTSGSTARSLRLPKYCLYYATASCGVRGMSTPKSDPRVGQ
ncbi:uncharacterized protein BDZ99DRAFT_462270 [Mytilinidion resinicola]|uniref:Uncharacterized protein n=1 Tax=Mytilinidion resinicola TaxID=574789 RepID=A0A6A6YSP7_9PEZI|nr:uncharacterized protein BDZ99DRAFT_462270 [Mytilinidion resinicola]KAF2810985.1 hypothetical protein BDZ99DRAFT_462270 [Mytilinidion resinicola]